MNTKLINFLIDDVRKLVDAINNDTELAERPLPDCGFDTLGDFASYWKCHINRITNK